jgi:hypothetical protein
MLRRNGRKRKQDGFTVVEAVIASAVLAVICGSFIMAYLGAMRTHGMATDYYRATCIARNRIQRAWTLSFDSLPLLVETAAPVDGNGNLDNSGHYRRTTVVTNEMSGRAHISVRVHFPVPNGRLSVQPVNVETLIAERS